MNLDMNKIHSDETKDYLLTFQKMILDSTFDFKNINQEKYEKKVDKLLETIGPFFKMDRAYLFTFNYENNTMIYSNEWCDTGIEPLPKIAEEISFDSYMWWQENLIQNKLIHIPDVSLMPKEASVEQDHLLSQGVKSIISVPITVDGKIEAFLGIDSVTSTGEWTEENIFFLHILVDILSKGITQLNYGKKINFMAHHDLLTELPNRLLLTKRLQKGIVEANQQEKSISILFLNLDGFKIINDTLGYQQGDTLLKQVAERLSLTVNINDTVARTDGDQFVLYMKDYCDEKELDQIISEVLKVFDLPFVLNCGEYIVTASVGISQYPKDGQDVETLIESAHTAMDKAKLLGKNQAVKYSEELKKETGEILSLTNDLHHALEQNEMVVYYQPQIKGTTGEIVGVEALLRWKHPEHGFVSPFKFIPLAEKTRLILPIGHWVLEAACKQWSEWQRKGLKVIKIGVNFSVHQLTHPSIIDEITNALEKNKMPAEYLDIEITESVAMDDNYEINETLKQISEMGITLSLDDYGKEYSSLKRLKEVSMHTMKVDMTFIQGIGLNKKDEIIVESVLSLASELGLKSVAEGVETKEQVDFLNKTSCDLLQGYYFYKPMPANEIEKLLI